MCNGKTYVTNPVFPIYVSDLELLSLPRIFVSVKPFIHQWTYRLPSLVVVMPVEGRRPSPDTAD